MAKTNGKPELDPPALDVDHELPAAGDGAQSPTESSAENPTETVVPAVEMERVQAERDALLDRLARLQAEFENARKRNAREQQEFREYALADALRSLLPILDSFDRALASQQPGTELRAGMELINRQLHDALSKLGVRPIPAIGEPFDPRLHEAVEAVETPGAGEDQVLEELQRGYKLKDRLLRPAMVRVARRSRK